MRISDWSSDVCSSDLFARCPDWWGPPALRIFSTNRVDETLVSANGGGGLDGWLFRRLCLFALLPATVIALLLLGFSTYWHLQELRTLARAEAHAVRNSVGSGKGVAGHFDFGGGLTI